MIFPFSALTLLAGWQEGFQPVINSSVAILSGGDLTGMVWYSRV